MFYVQCLFLENHAVYEIMCKNIVERGRTQGWQCGASHCMLDT